MPRKRGRTSAPTATIARFVAALPLPCAPAMVGEIGSRNGLDEVETASALVVAEAEKILEFSGGLWRVPEQDDDT